MIVYPMNRQTVVSDLLNTYPDRASLWIQFGNFTIKVSSNDTEVINGLKDYFKDFITSSQSYDMHIRAVEGPSPEFSFSFIEKLPDPGKTKIKEEYVDIRDGRIVRKRLTGMVFIFGCGDHVAIGPCRKNINQVVNFINNRYIERKLCEGGLLGHAAGIIWKNRGLALAGFSGAGKSTLALHLMNRGAVFVSNDRLIIEKKEHGLRMQGVAKMPRINPGTVLNNPNLSPVMPEEDRQRFSQMTSEDLWRIEYKYDAPIGDCYGENRFKLSHAMHGLVILTWRRSDNKKVTCQTVDLRLRLELLEAFIKPAGLFFFPDRRSAVCEPTPENYLDFLSHAIVWELSGGINFDQAADILTARLEAIPI